MGHAVDPIEIAGGRHGYRRIFGQEGGATFDVVYSLAVGR